MNEGYHSHIIEHPEISVQDAKILRKYVRGARRIVDVGCGRGGFVETCLSWNGGGIGLDPELSAGRICTARELPFVLGNAVALPFMSASLDVVRAKDVIEHWTDALVPMREIYRVLKPGGLFLCYVPSQFSTLYPVANFWDDYTHVRPLTRFGLRRLLEDGGLEVIFIKGYTPGRNLPERALARLLSAVFPRSWWSLARKPLS